MSASTMMKVVVKGASVGDGGLRSHGIALVVVGRGHLVLVVVLAYDSDSLVCWYLERRKKKFNNKECLK